MAKIHEWQDKYRSWWRGKLVKMDNGEVKRVFDIKLYGPPSFVYGSAEFIFADDTRQTIHTESFKPRKSDVEIVLE